MIIPGVTFLVLLLSGVVLVNSGQTGRIEGRSALRARFPGDDALQAAFKESIVLSATANLMERINRRENSGDMLALARLQLLRGQRDQSVDTMKEAVRLFPVESTARAGLAAALLERFASERSQDDLLDAVEQAQRAVELDPNSPVASFNLALGLEWLHLRTEAASEWRRCVSIDRSPDWAREEQAHAGALTGPLIDAQWQQRRAEIARAASDPDASWIAEVVRNFPQQTRHLVEEELLPQWSRHRDDRTLLIATRIADSLKDRLLSDSLALIDRERGLNREQMVSLLAASHEGYALARRLYRENQVNAALEEAQESARGFERAGSPFQLRVRLLISSCMFSRNDLVGARKEVRSLESDLGQHAAAYPVLQGQAAWMSGLLDIVLGHPTAAADKYLKSLRALEPTGEVENIAGIHGMLAEAYEYLGERDRAFNHRDEAARLIASQSESDRIDSIFGEAADAAISRNPRIALLYQNALVRIARDRRVPTDVSDSLTWRGLIHFRLNKQTLAISDLLEARQAAVQIEDHDSRLRIEADIDATEGRIRARSSPREAIELLTRSIDFFSRQGNVFFHPPQLHLERGRCFLRVGKPRAAEADFRRGLELLETHRFNVDTNSLRLSFFERSEELFNEAIALCLKRLDHNSAIALMERSRARALLDSYSQLRANSARIAVPRGIDDIRKNLPATTAIIEYSALPGGLVIAVLRRDGVFLTWTAFKPAQIGEICERFSEAISRKDPQAFLRASAAGYEAFVKPIRGSLAGIQSLVFVPDGRLHEVPFAALLDSSTNQHMIEARTIATSPSASVFVESRVRAQKLRSENPRVTIIADPAIDRIRYPLLADLPGANREASGIARLYRTASVISGHEATIAAFRREFARSPIVHYGGHAVENERHPDYAALLLASPHPSTESALYARDIAQFQSGPARLVILAACSTARGKAWRVEGSNSIARAFLAAGVPTVVATNWPVDDNDTSALMLRFHSELASGTPVAESLRRAQLSLLGGPGRDRSLLSWAAFQLIGGPDG